MDLTLEGFLNTTAIAASLFMVGLIVSLGWQAGIRLAAKLFGATGGVHTVNVFHHTPQDSHG